MNWLRWIGRHKALAAGVVAGIGALVVAIVYLRGSPDDDAILRPELPADATVGAGPPPDHDAILRPELPADATVAGPPPDHVVIDVFYGTNRARTGAGSLKRFYSGERGDLSFGIAKVSIPRAHEMGHLESPTWWKLEWAEDPAEHVILRLVEPLERARFLRDLRASIERSDAPEALVFLHGYNVVFKDAARRTAQIAYDLQFPGTPVLYSWPSKGTTRGYLADGENAKVSVTHFQNFLKLVLAEIGARTVHVIAHSMGNRVLVESLAKLNIGDLPEGSAKLRQVVFAAPDIDRDNFIQLAQAFRATAEQFTLYASSNDLPLKYSKTIHDYPRAGDSGEGLVIVSGVDTVDASNVNTGFQGHSYFADSRSVLSDLYWLIKEGKRPGDRFGLIERKRADAVYWAFKP